MLIHYIRTSTTGKVVSLVLTFSFLSQLLVSFPVRAITSGPTQPEVLGCQPVGSSDMVDLFSGDFSYNIPLMDVGGYPINLSYQSGITMEQEASWVGLGWSLNPGAIVRNVRGLPDDFKGDEVTKEFDVKPQHTVGVTVSADDEFLGMNSKKLLGGKFKWNLGVGLSYNNYTGIGVDLSASPTISSGENSKTGKTANLGLGLKSSSETGLDIEPTFSVTSSHAITEKKTTSITGRIGLPFNSREGLKELSFGAGINTSIAKTNKEGKVKTTSIGPKSGATDFSALSFVSTSFSPQISMPMMNYSISFSFSLGGEVIGDHPRLNLAGYYSLNILSTQVQTLPAFGYLYSQNANSNKALLDFTREKDGSFSDYTPNLPISNYTYDIYNVSGQGIGGNYRPFRGDVGILFDPEVSNVGGSLNLPGLEFGGGAGFRLGVNMGVNMNHSVSGKWGLTASLFGSPTGNELESFFPFKDYTNDNVYEPAFFKQTGEKTATSNRDYFDKTGGFSPVRVCINRIANGSANTCFEGGYSGCMVGQNTRPKREPRIQNMSFLNATDASSFGLEKNIRNYTQNGFTMDKTERRYSEFTENTPRVNANSKPHHISEITVTKPDGSRYVYGIPAYNTKQIEASFAVKGNPSPLGLIPYNGGIDNEVGQNTNGIDNFVSKTSTPPYAHSFLLTAILSPDYMDRKGDGPTDDDFGNYTRINYTRAIANYKWRTPYEMATFNEGLKSDDMDNKGSYIYGEKEIWYVHSIETKTYVAEFFLENRDDGYGVIDENRGRASDNPLRCLKTISLYSKPDKLFSVTPTPIKEVHFEYNYSLCKGIKNNKNTNGGKLTLNKVYFTYGSSGKGTLSPYEFVYGDPAHNYDYNFNDVDRWGNYKKAQGYWSLSAITGKITNAEFPYTEQLDPATEKSQTNDYAKAWNLSEINLPSGGHIKIDYESDDYAFVQDKPAMQMVMVEGVASTEGGIGIENKSSLVDGFSDTPKQYLYFKVPKGTVKSDIYNYYLRGQLSNIYFRFLMNIDGKYNDSGQNAIDGKYEYVPGYTDIENDGYGVQIANNITYGWIKLPNTTYELNAETSPITFAAWNFTKLNLPRVAHHQPNIGGNVTVLSIVEALAASLINITDIITGIYARFDLESYGESFVVGKSFIRLYNPDGKKLGGGARVANITIDDQWSELTGNSGYENSEYGQEYKYTAMEKLSDGTEREISSGVAAYEPLLGGDENPWRTPVPYSKHNYFVVDDNFFQETPFGESFFPAPTVGYSRVEVKNITPIPTNASLKKHGTGRVVHEFYTARDFPTIPDRTEVKPIHIKPFPLFLLFETSIEDYMTASQGFSVELNDMHGKQKAQWVYQEGSNDPISGVEYFYHRGSATSTRNSGITIPVSNQLDNTVPVVYKYSANGAIIQDEMVGVDYDLAMDMRQQESSNYGFNVGGNLDAFLAAILPFAIPTVFPDFSQQQVRFKSVVTTKVINRSGLLDSVVAYDLGSKVVTKNLLYDAETGEVLLTETKNQFDDPVYNFTYPAHWGYDGMGPAYKNEGAKLSQLVADISFAGDEVGVVGTSGKYWVNETVKAIIGQDGNQVTATGDIKIIRSGRRNQQTTSLGTVTTLQNPISGKKLVFNKVINANAVEFSDRWGMFCNCEEQPPKVGDSFNPYFWGVRGNFRPKKSYLYLTGRTQSVYDDNTNIRTDGVFNTSFSDFWTDKNSGDWQINNSTPWTWTSEVTAYSPYGFELENQDALHRYSSAIYGYNHTLPISVATNSQYKNAGFDGFEDYKFSKCVVDHFNFKKDFDSWVTDRAHSGRKSIKVLPNDKATMMRILKVCP